jgi:hypothetical protein
LPVSLPARAAGLGRVSIFAAGWSSMSFILCIKQEGIRIIRRDCLAALSMDKKTEQ